MCKIGDWLGCFPTNLIMPKQILIADSGATKTEWVLVSGKIRKRITTPGISPYFMDEQTIESLILKSFGKKFKADSVDQVFFYGTGCAAPQNARLVKSALTRVWPHSKIEVADDLLGATRALCGRKAGIACILGTGSSSSYYNGKKIVQQRPGLGYVLGDEGSGAYLGKKVIQYYLYDLLEKELKALFEKKYGKLDRASILDAVYKQPLPSRFLATFTHFLSENRGHYMVENILEDGLQEFFFHHIRRYKQAGQVPIHFTGSIAYVFRDWIKSLCHDHGYEIGQIIPKPINGLIQYHQP